MSALGRKRTFANGCFRPKADVRDDILLSDRLVVIPSWSLLALLRFLHSS